MHMSAATCVAGTGRPGCTLALQPGSLTTNLLYYLRLNSIYGVIQFLVAWSTYVRTYGAWPVAIVLADSTLIYIG